MNPNGYIIDFTIPQGPTGATGPTGPASSDGAVGYISDFREYSGTFLPSRDIVTLDLGVSAWGLNVSYATKNKIIFQTEGGYKIDFGTVIQVPSASPDNIVQVNVCPSVNDHGLSFGEL